MRLIVIAGAMVVGCSSPTQQGSLRVFVELEPGLKSRCARVVARGLTVRESTPVLLDGRTSFVVGVTRDEEGPDVLVQANGYSDEACTTPTEPPEASESLVGEFGSPTPSVLLTLRQRVLRDGGTDADGDGFFLGGGDCDDENGAVHPEASESCVNALDDDCDSAIDCRDTDCAAQACGVGGQCTGGVCVAPAETGLCSDGLDNDGDGLSDCADSDCPSGAACNDANACTRGDVCGASGCVGSAIVCNQPPSACFENTGTCSPADGRCTYPARTGSCDDGLTCTTNDTCRPDGTCAGTQRTCSSPPGPCRESTGQCSETEGCVYAPRSGACPGGTCNGSGVCVPTQVVDAFPYTPTNFASAQLPTSAGAAVITCDVTIETSGSAVGWSTCSAGPQPPQSAVVGSSMVLFFDSLSIGAGATVRAVGSRPLIIAVRHDAMIAGTLTVNSDGVRGAGADVACTSGEGENGGASGNPQTAGGGGGGGFGTNGGKGADGDDGGSDGDRGNANGNSNLTPLRGGCAGGDGGRASQGSGRGGHGGGAIQLSVGGTLTVDWGATISAHGEGGKGGLANQRIGGGGGGSGGAILLEATRLELNAGAAVVANGGAGGEGSGSLDGGDGQHGQRSTLRAMPLSLTCGGNGGNGGARAGEPGNAREPNCGDDLPGGGGGGSEGRVRFNARQSCSVSGAALISPEPAQTANCH